MNEYIKSYSISTNTQVNNLSKSRFSDSREDSHKKTGAGVRKSKSTAPKK